MMKNCRGEGSPFMVFSWSMTLRSCDVIRVSKHKAHKPETGSKAQDRFALGQEDNLFAYNNKLKRSTIDESGMNQLAFRFPRPSHQPKLYSDCATAKIGSNFYLAQVHDEASCDFSGLCQSVVSALLCTGRWEDFPTLLAWAPQTSDFEFAF